jgi:hypothetical protein
MTGHLNDVMNEIVKSVDDLTNGDKDMAGQSARISMDLTQLIVQVNSMESDLHDCVNELCLKCGSYHEAYLGACDGCRWKKVKEDLR